MYKAITFILILNYFLFSFLYNIKTVEVIRNHVVINTLGPFTNVAIRNRETFVTRFKNFIIIIIITTTTTTTTIIINKYLVEANLLHLWIIVPPRGGVTPLYGLYRYVRSQRVWFFSRFGHK